MQTIKYGAAGLSAFFTLDLIANLGDAGYEHGQCIGLIMVFSGVSLAAYVAQKVGR